MGEEGAEVGAEVGDEEAKVGQRVEQRHDKKGLHCKGPKHASLTALSYSD